MAKVVAFTVSPTKRIGFIVESNKDKSIKEFIAHEKHHGLTDGQYWEVYQLIQKEAGHTLVRSGGSKQDIKGVKEAGNAFIDRKGMKEDIERATRNVDNYENKEAPAPEPGPDDTAAG